MSSFLNRSSQKKILLLGAGLMQIPAVNAVRDKNYYLIIADANKDAIAVGLADEFWHIDLRNIDALCKSAKNAGIQAVFTCATDFSYAVSSIAKACNIPGLPPEIAQTVNYKNYMRKVFQEKNIPSPAFYICTKNEIDNNNYYQHAQKVGYPLVVKPVDNMGARGICCVAQEMSLQIAVETALQYSPSKTIILEQKLEGPELSIDSFVLDGVLYPVGIADRHIYFLPYFIETGHSIPSRLSAEQVKDACECMQLAAKALQINNAAFKGDIIFHKNKAYIGECAARLSGGYMSGWTIPYAHSIYPAEYALTLASGDKEDSQDMMQTLIKTSQEVLQKNHLYALERAIISLPGIIQSVDMPSKLYKYNSDPPYKINQQGSKTQNAHIKNIIINIKKGHSSVLPTNNTQKAGNIIVCGNSYESANEYASEVLSDIYCNVVPNDEVDLFLFSDNEDDIQKYERWFCYPQLLKQYQNELCISKVDKQKLEQNIDLCCNKNKLGIYLQDDIKLNKEIGSWTHCRVIDVIKYAIIKEQVYYVPTEESSINVLALKAMLRGGWQAIYYMLFLLKTCKDRLEKFL